MSDIPNQKKSLATYLITLCVVVNALVLIIEAAFLSDYLFLVNSVELILCLPSIVGVWQMKKWGIALASSTLCIILGTSMSTVLLGYYLYGTLAAYAFGNIFLVIMNVMTVIYLFEAIFEKPEPISDELGLHNDNLESIDLTSKPIVTVKAVQSTHPFSGKTMHSISTFLGLRKGKLELTENNLNFLLTKGVLKKRAEVFLEIPLPEIESVASEGNELTINWNQISKVFIIKQSQFGVMCDRLSEALTEQKKISEQKEATKQRLVIAEILASAFEVMDSLFDVLRSLHGQVDWIRIKSQLERASDNSTKLAGQRIALTNPDFTRLFKVVEEQLPEETSKETFDLLKSLLENFGAASKNDFPSQIHPNFHDAEETMAAYYTLNNIILGVTVGDEEILKESNDLISMLKKLSKEMGFPINLNQISEVLTRLIAKKGTDDIVEESRTAFRQQLKDLLQT